MKQEHTKYIQIKTNLGTVKWALCDKTQSTEL